MSSSSAAWTVVVDVSHVTRVGYHPKPPKDRTESSIRWMILFFIATAVSLWIAG